MVCLQTNLTEIVLTVICLSLFAKHSTGFRFLLPLATSTEGINDGGRLRKLHLTNVGAGSLSSVSPNFLFLIDSHPPSYVR